MKKYTPYFYSIAGYCLITLLLAFPLVLKLRECILFYPGSWHDADATLWLYWWTKLMLFKKGFFYTQMIGYPFGRNLLMQYGGFFNPVFSVPFQYLCGLIASYNMIILCQMVVAGFGMFLLVQYICKDRIAAFISGFVFFFNPTFLFFCSQGQADQLSMGFLPLYILYLFKAADSHKGKHVMLAAVFLALAAFSYLVYGIFLLIFTALWLLSIFSTRHIQKKAVKDILLITGIIVALFMVILSPYLYLFIKSALSQYWPRFVHLKFAISRGELLDVKNLPMWISFLKDDSIDLFAFLPGNRFTKHPIFLFSCLLIFLVKEKPKFWLAACAVFLALSLGPYLKINGRFVSTASGNVIALPYIFLHNYFPFFSTFHWPSRFLVMAYLCAAVVCGYLVAQLRKDLRLKYGKVAIAFLAASYILYQNASVISHKKMFPLVTLKKMHIPGIYDTLAKEKGGAIIEYLSDEESSPFPYFYFQTFHQKKFLIVRRSEKFLKVRQRKHAFPASLKAFQKNNAFLTFLIEHSEADFDPQKLRKSVNELMQIGFTYLLVHHQTSEPGSVAEFMKRLEEILGPPEISKKEAALFSLRRNLQFQ